MAPLLVSLMNSSQASQKSMFSSLNSVRRNCRNALLPAGQHISLSKDWPHERASSTVGFGLSGQQGISRILVPAEELIIILSLMVLIPLTACLHMLHCLASKCKNQFDYSLLLLNQQQWRKLTNTHMCRTINIYRMCTGQSVLILTLHGWLCRWLCAHPVVR